MEIVKLLSVGYSILKSILISPIKFVVEPNEFEAAGITD